jgi:hypothetical protein
VVDELGRFLESIAPAPLKLALISSRGTAVYPAEAAADDVRWYRCRFLVPEGEQADDAAVASAIPAILAAVTAPHRWMHVEKLHVFDGELGYTRAGGVGA